MPCRSYKKKFTYEQLAMTIRCLDGKKAEDVAFLQKILNFHANATKRDSHGNTHLFSLIPDDNTPVSLELLQVLLEAKTNPFAFMKHLKDPFCSIERTRTQAAYECCQKFLDKNRYLPQ